MTGLILQYAFNYTAENRPELKNFTEMQQMANYLSQQNLVEGFANFADKNGLRRRNLMISKSHTLLQTVIFSRIIYTMLDEEAWNEYLNQDDKTVETALRVLREGKAFPQKPLIMRTRQQR